MLFVRRLPCIPLAAAEKEWEIVAKKHADLSRELDELYSKKGDEWVNNIVAQVIGE